MSTATITKPKTETKHATPAKKLTKATPTKAEKKNCGSNVPCENCEVKTKRKKPVRKKKPMFKLGSWRGAFKGTLDF